MSTEKLEFSFELAARVLRFGDDNSKAITVAANDFYEEAMRRNALVRELKAENQRLRHENEFMLQLLNERDE